MATEQEYINAAKKPPSSRSVEDQALVAQGQNMTSVRNADFEARENARTGRQ